MTETNDFPSKTETDSAELVPMSTGLSQPALPAGPDVVFLASGEVDHLRHLEDRNRFLTMLLGDRMMTVDETRAELLEHRKSLKESYNFVLMTHGVEQGKIDTSSGVITVLKRTPKE